MKIAILFFSTLIILILASTCYYDSQEYLYPKISQCDSTGTIPYARVDSVFHNNGCIDCHDSPNSSGGFDLTDYTVVHERNNY